MRVTPLDIIQKQFTESRRGGYEPDEVRDFLDAIRDSLEETLRANQRLREEISRRDAEIAEMRNSESDIKNALMLARRVSDDMERNSRREADIIVGEARIEAERILMAVSEERRELQADIVRLRSNRARLHTDLRAVLEGYSRMVDDLGREAPAAR
jgi:cell division initiation protein